MNRRRSASLFSGWLFPAATAAVYACLAFSGAAAAQEETRHGIFIESLEVSVVNIEVVVTDKDGKPITGLTTDDFELIEDGKTIEISNFYAVENARRVGAFGLPLEPEDTAGGERAEPAGEEGLTPREVSLLAEISKSFEVSADPDGIRLLPRWRDAGFDELEIDGGRLTLDGEPVDGETLRLRAGPVAELVVRLTAVDQDGAAAFFNIPEGSKDGDDALPDNQKLFLVIFIDNQNLSPPHRNRVLDELEVQLRRTVRPGDRVMVASFDRRVRIEQPFTNNLSRVTWSLSRISKMTGQSPLQNERRRIASRMNAQGTPTTITAGSLGGADSGETDQDIAERLLAEIRTYAGRAEVDARVTFDALSSFVDSLAGLPGRKAVLYVSEGLETRPGESLFQAWSDRFSRGGQGFTQILSPQSEAGKYDTSSEMRRVAAHAAANRVTFYTFDAAGSKRALGISAESAGSPTDFGLDTRFSEQETLLYLAAATGGQALLGVPRAEKLLERLASDFSDYYSLGYVSPKAGDGKYHRVKVRVRRDGVKLRHVEGYQDKTPEQKMADRTLSALILDIARNPLGIRVQLGDEKQEKKNRWVLPMVVKIPISKLALIPQDKNHHGKVSVYLAVQDQQGRLSPPQRIEVPVTIPNQDLLSAMGQEIGYRVSVQIRPGESKMAVGVRDELAATDSTVNLSVSVGDG